MLLQVKPSIIQINLSSCCVVPPALQEFTKQNDVQLLTHNDPIGKFVQEQSLKLQCWEPRTYPSRYLLGLMLCSSLCCTGNNFSTDG